VVWHYSALVSMLFAYLAVLAALARLPPRGQLRLIISPRTLLARRDPDRLGLGALLAARRCSLSRCRADVMRMPQVRTRVMAVRRPRTEDPRQRGINETSRMGVARRLRQDCPPRTHAEGIRAMAR